MVSEVYNVQVHQTINRKKESGRARERERERESERESVRERERERVCKRESERESGRVRESYCERGKHILWESSAASFLVCTINHCTDGLSGCILS